MTSKGISGKGQGSANSKLKKPNCSRIDMEGATINSGYHSGREKNRKKNENASSSDLGGCKGTDRSYKGTDRSHNATSRTINLAGGTHNLGALSGGRDEGSGTVEIGNKGVSQTSNSVPNKLQHQGSNVSGTRGSFNAGSSAPCKGCKQHSLNITDTRDSFDVKGQHLKIERPHINSDACAGSAEKVKKLIKGNPLEGCSGTDQSFNGLSHGEVIINRGKLNTGAYSGNTTLERGKQP